MNHGYKHHDTCIMDGYMHHGYRPHGYMHHRCMHIWWTNMNTIRLFKNDRIQILFGFPKKTVSHSVGRIFELAYLRWLRACYPTLGSGFSNIDERLCNWEIVVLHATCRKSGAEERQAERDSSPVEEQRPRLVTTWQVEQQEQDRQQTNKYQSLLKSVYCSCLCLYICP